MELREGEIVSGVVNRCGRRCATIRVNGAPEAKVRFFHRDVVSSGQVHIGDRVLALLARNPVSGDIYAINIMRGKVAG